MTAEVSASLTCGSQPEPIAFHGDEGHLFGDLVLHRDLGLGQARLKIPATPQAGHEQLPRERAGLPLHVDVAGVIGDVEHARRELHAPAFLAAVFEKMVAELMPKSEALLVLS